MSEQWTDKRQHLDVRLDGSLDLSTEQLMVPPDRLLRARNVVYDKTGTARLRPTRVEGAALAGATGITGWAWGANTPYRAFSRGNECLAITKDGLTRWIPEGPTWLYPYGTGVVRPGWNVRSYDLESRTCTASGWARMLSYAYIEHQGYHVFAYVPLTSAVTLAGAYVQVHDSDGQVLLTHLMDTFTWLNGPIELLPAGGTSASCAVRIVWRSNSTEFRSVKVTITPSSATVSSVFVLASVPHASSTSHACCHLEGYGASVDAGFALAYLNGAATWQIDRYNDSTTRTHTYNTAINGAAGTVCDIDRIDENGTDRIAAVFVNNTSGNVDLVDCAPADLTGPVITAGAITGITAVTATVTSAYGSYFVAVDDGTDQIRSSIYDTSHTLRASDTTQGGYLLAARAGSVDGIPVLPLLDVYNGTAFGRGISLCSVSWAVGPILQYNPCARIGVDSATTDSVVVGTLGIIGKVRGTGYTASLGYLHQLSGWPQTVRGVRLSAGSVRTTRYAEANGCTYVSGSVPLVYDGRGVVEVGWLQPPVITSVGSGGSGDTVAVATWSVRAVFVWLDATGRAHRSPPSDPVTWANGSAANRMQVNVVVPYHHSHWSRQDTAWPMSSGTQEFFTEFYVQRVGTDTDHKLAYAQNTAAQRTITAFQPTSYTKTTGIGVFNYVSPDSAGAVLYTDAGFLESSPLPAVADFEAIGDRMWALDAEDRTRLWPSKTLEPGYAFEWSAALAFNVPGSDVLALSQVNTLPLLLRSDGLYVVYGDGPTNGGVNGEWSVPRRVEGAPGCINGDAVCKLQDGSVFYLSDDGPYLLRRDLTAVPVGPDLDDAVRALDVRSATYSQADNRVVLWTQGTGSPAVSTLCFDTALGKWSEWYTSRNTYAAVQLLDGRVWVIDADGSSWDPGIYETGVSSGEAALKMYWRTAWLQPAGLHGRVRWHRIRLTMRRIASHQLNVRLYAHGDDGTLTGGVNFTDANISAELQGQIYTVEVDSLFSDPDLRTARAIMIEVEADRQADTGTACQPLAMRVEFSTDGDSRSVRAGTGSRK